jgi:hypothetical protein
MPAAANQSFTADTGQAMEPRRTATTAPPGTFADPLTEVLRNGARALLSHTVEAGVAALLDCHADKVTDEGRLPFVASI